MFPSDTPLAALFTAFLVCFVLIGLIPFWTRIVRRIKAFRYPFAAPRPQSAVAETPAGDETPYSCYEFMLLRKLAREPERRLSARGLAAALLIRRAAVDAALSALLERGLVEFARPTLIERRYYLSRRGHTFAIRQGFIPDYRAPEDEPRRQIQTARERPRAVAQKKKRLRLFRGRRRSG